MSVEYQTANSTQCFVQRGDHYLVLERGVNKRIMPGVVMAPGGKLEPGEGVFAGTRREVLEETGLQINNLQIRASATVVLRDIAQEFHLHVLTASDKGGELVPESENGTLHWLNQDEIINHPQLLAELRDVLPHIFSSNPEVISYRAVYEKGNEMVEFEIENPK